MSTLDEVVREVVGAVEGLDDVLLVDRDGMIVASAAPGREGRIELIAAALVDLVARARDAASEAEIGFPGELMLTHADGALIYRAINPDYGVIAIVGGGGLLGRARFELRKVAARLLPEID